MVASHNQNASSPSAQGYTVHKGKTNVNKYVVRTCNTMYTASKGSVPPRVTCKTGRIAPKLPGFIRLKISARQH